MKTKSLFLIALLSMFSLVAFAESDTTYVEINYPSDSIFNQGDTLHFTAKSTNASAVTEQLWVRILTNGWGTLAGLEVKIPAPITFPLDTFIVIPEDMKMKDCPAEGDNPFNLLQVGVDGGWNAGPLRFSVTKKEGQDCPAPSTITKIADIIDLSTIVIRDGAPVDTLPFNQKWNGWSVKPGDILHVKGTYEVETDGATVDNVYAKIVYLGPGNWSDNFWAHNFTFDSQEKGNVDGVMDAKMVVPYFVPDSLLKGSDNFLGDDAMKGADGFHPLMQIRVVYDESPELENLQGAIGTNNTFQNYSGPVNMYTGDMPTLGANVTGVKVESIGDTSVALSWDLASDASWDVIVAPKGEVRNADSYDEFINTNGIPTVVAGLNPGTEYEVFVRSVSNPDTSVTSPLRTVGVFGDAVEFTTTGTAALRNLSVNDNVSIYPNPTTGIITISADKVYAITVCDLAGRTILRKSMTSAKQELDLSDINNGIYLLQFSNGQESFAKKFMKQ